MHQRAVDHFYKEERTIMRDPIDLKQSGRSRSRGSVQIGLVILTVIAIIIASIVVFQPFSSTHRDTVPATTIDGTTLTVGGTSDVEGQLLTKLYTLLLRKAGFTVNEKPAVVDSSKLFPALQRGSIDIYPEFTFTGLQRLGIASVHDSQKDYQTVKNGFQQRFKITWLDPAPLNDGYTFCTTQDEAAQLHINTISDLASQVSGLILSSSNDGIALVDSLKPVYNFDTHSFKSLLVYTFEGISFDALENNQAQINVCYITDASAKTRNFVFLIDDKNGFPQFHLAPIVRDNVLHKNPAIANALNPLAPKLTTDVSIRLQARVQQLKSSGTSSSDAITQVATDFLKSQGLL